MIEAESDPRPISPERLVIFSDAVFAIAMTLLALELHLPEEAYRSGALAQALTDSWPKVLSFIISFMVIAQFWRAHVRAFTWIERVDTRLITLNLLLLMVVCFLPFPTGVLGNGGNEPVAVELYAATVTLASLFQALLWIHAAAWGKLVRAEVPLRVRHFVAWRSLIPAIVFAISIGIARAGYPGPAMYSWIAIMPLFWVLRAVVGRP